MRRRVGPSLAVQTPPEMSSMVKQVRGGEGAPGTQLTSWFIIPHPLSPLLIRGGWGTPDPASAASVED